MPRAKKSVKSAVAPDETPIAPAPVTPTAASTATEVKTKVVSKTAMAVAVAFLGFAAIAAGMLTLPQSGPSGSNCFDSDYATKNDGGSSVLRYSFINQATKGTAYGIQTNSTQFVSSTDKCWDSKKLLEFFCDVKNNKVTWNSYNCAAGTSCVDGACVSAGKPDLLVTDISMSPSVNDPIKKDISVTVKNIGNAVAPPFVINLYQKNADGSNQILSWAELSEMNPGVTTVYTTNKLLPTTITLASEVDPDNKIIESNETNNYFEKTFGSATSTTQDLPDLTFKLDAKGNGITFVKLTSPGAKVTFVNKGTVEYKEGAIKATAYWMDENKNVLSYPSDEKKKKTEYEIGALKPSVGSGSYSFSIIPDPKARYLKVVIDQDNKLQELVEDNNMTEIAIPLDFISNIDGSVAKTCNDIVPNDSAPGYSQVYPYYFDMCKNSGFASVCLNKYTLDFQGCDNGTGCVKNNVNSAKNILCLVGSGVAID